MLHHWADCRPLRTRAKHPPGCTELLEGRGSQSARGPAQTCRLGTEGGCALHADDHLRAFMSGKNNGSDGMC